MQYFKSSVGVGLEWERKDFIPIVLKLLSLSLSLNIIGFTEAIATRTALENIRQNVRSFVISRSTFPGSGVHTGHWTGDNTATAQDMYFSIPGILSFQMFGVPLVGSDICGFIGKF